MGESVRTFENEARDPAEAAPPLCLCSDSAQRTAELSPCGEEKGIHATLGAAASPQALWLESQSMTTPLHSPVQASPPLKERSQSKRGRPLTPHRDCSLCKDDMKTLLRPPEYLVSVTELHLILHLLPFYFRCWRCQSSI